MSFEKLKNPNHIFVIAEAGSNWKCGSYEDDLEMARKLIITASKAGADAVKFQTFKSETTYVPKAGVSKHLSEKGITQEINEIFNHLSMPYKMIPELAKICEKEKIMFMSTPFSISDAKEIDPYVEIHKIASFEINHVRLLEFLAKTKKPVIISTGASTFTEIDFLSNLMKKQNNSNFALMQCTSRYPAPIESLNLRVISELRLKYDIPVGFSDHSLDPLIGPLIAIGLGATIIEKHFTMDKKLPGPDNSFALNPMELELMVSAIRKGEKSLGTGKKEILEEEFEQHKIATRSIQAIKNISKGEILKEGENFEILRPGNRIRGLDARYMSVVNGKKAKSDIKIGDGITEYE